MNERSTQQAATAAPITHGSFSVERVFRHPRDRVFRALTDEAISRRWRAEGEGWKVVEFKLDARVGAGERSRFSYQDGPEIRLESQYQDIVPNERLVFTYRMSLGGEPISVSLATIELFPDGGRTRLVQTEQGAYFGPGEHVRGREEGTRALLAKLDEELSRAS